MPESTEGVAEGATTVGAENTFVFNIAWSLQMPLFILISGCAREFFDANIRMKSLLIHKLKRS